VTDADYAALLGLAVDANMNMLRVWGGGVREKRGFYAEADRLGLLIWQEFPHACAFAARFPRSAEYLQLAAQEAGAIVRALRNHPSVVLWCGGNEFSPRRNRPLVSALAGAAAAEDGSRPFHPASPSGGEGHNWIVWHQRAPVSDYRGDDSLFASEFGLQAVPGIDSLQRFIPPGELWPPGPAWLHHNAELAKLAFYARPYVAAPEPAGRPAYTSEWTAHFDSAETFATATQRAQADGLQVAIEHFRRRKGRTGGCLVWQLNEPWPAISWALIDYYRLPKQAYRRVQRAYNPLLVSLEFALRQYQAGETVSAAVWVINDWPRALPDCEIEVSLGQGPPLWTARRDVAADSVERIGELRFVLPPHGPGAWALVARIAQAGRLLGENGYQLDTHDWRRLPLAARLAARWAKRLLE
jgi:beta-mannosidase